MEERITGRGLVSCSLGALPETMSERADDRGNTEGTKDQTTWQGDEGDGVDRVTGCFISSTDTCTQFPEAPNIGMAGSPWP